MNPIQWLTAKINGLTGKITDWSYGKNYDAANSMLKQKPPTNSPEHLIGESEEEKEVEAETVEEEKKEEERE